MLVGLPIYCAIYTYIEQSTVQSIQPLSYVNKDIYLKEECYGCGTVCTAWTLNLLTAANKRHLLRPLALFLVRPIIRITIKNTISLVLCNSKPNARDLLYK